MSDHHAPGYYAGPVRQDDPCYCCGREQRGPVELGPDWSCPGVDLVLFAAGGAPFPICADRRDCDEFREAGNRLAARVRDIFVSGATR